MSTTVQVRKKGQFTIPIKMREMLGEEAMVVIPQKLKTEKILREASLLAKKNGITMEEMLAELDEIRHHS